MIIAVMYVIFQVIKANTPIISDMFRSIAEPIGQIIIVICGMAMLASCVTHVNVGHPIESVINGIFGIIKIVLVAIIKFVAWVGSNLCDVIKKTWKATHDRVKVEGAGIGNAILSIILSLVAVIIVI